MLWEFLIDPQIEQKASFPAQIVAIWAQRVTLRMCQKSGPEDGDMPKNRVAPHSVVPMQVLKKPRFAVAICCISTHVFWIRRKTFFYARCKANLTNPPMLMAKF